MFGIGGWEMLLIGVVALLVFGPKRLPELARSMGKGLAEFRRASSDLRRSLDLDTDPTRVSAPDPVSQPPAQAGSPAAADALQQPAEVNTSENADAGPVSDALTSPPGHGEYEPEPAGKSSGSSTDDPPSTTRG